MRVAEAAVMFVTTSMVLWRLVETISHDKQLKVKKSPSDSECNY